MRIPSFLRDVLELLAKRIRRRREFVGHLRTPGKVLYVPEILSCGRAPDKPKFSSLTDA